LLVENGLRLGYNVRRSLRIFGSGGLDGTLIPIGKPNNFLMIFRTRSVHSSPNKSTDRVYIDPHEKED
jgi:hypothetical protein